MNNNNTGKVGPRLNEGTQIGEETDQGAMEPGTSSILVTAANSESMTTYNQETGTS